MSKLEQYCRHLKIRKWNVKLYGSQEGYFLQLEVTTSMNFNFQIREINFQQVDRKYTCRHLVSISKSSFKSDELQLLLLRLNIGEMESLDLRGMYKEQVPGHLKPSENT